jgi:hypothetical protein
LSSLLYTERDYTFDAIAIIIMIVLMMVEVEVGILVEQPCNLEWHSVYAPGKN